MQRKKRFGLIQTEIVSEMIQRSQIFGGSDVQNKERKGWGFLKTKINYKRRKSRENNVPEEVILSFLKVRSQGADKTIPTKHETVKKSN